MKCLSDHLLYVWIIPLSEQEEMGRVEALQLSQEHLRPLDHRPSGISFEPNRYGVLSYESGHDQTITSGCQLFKTRELWAFNSYYLSKHSDQLGVPTGCHEATLATGLRSYLQVAQEALGISLPITVEIGISNVEGHVLFVDPQYRGWEKVWGPIHEPEVFLRSTVTNGSDEEIDGILLAEFERIFDAAGRKRPENYFGFPGDKPSTNPVGY